jgi:hypothetical protein
MTDKQKWIIACLLPILMILGKNMATGQSSNELKEGTISYISTNNVYVKFISTTGIEEGDTLYTRTGDKTIASLVVLSRSSLSCLCNPIGEVILKTGDKIWAIPKIQLSAPPIEMPEPGIPDKDIGEKTLASTIEQKVSGKRETEFSGRLSVASYSLFSGTGSDSYRMRYSLSASASYISGSKLSSESYAIFTHKINEWNVVNQNIFDALKIYSLAVKYEMNRSMTARAGRIMNPRIANMGSYDGLEFGVTFGKMNAGIFAGTSPDPDDYGFNLNLLRYGLWAGHSIMMTNGYAQSSVAFYDQLYFGKTDRRVVYFQHTNTIIRNLTLFTSLELDLFKLENDQPVSMIDLTSFYLSMNFRASPKISVSGIYDNRKNVIYYETFRNYADEVLQQSVRQGLRFRVNYMPLRVLALGITAGTRQREGDFRATNTLNGSATWSKMPAINTTLSLTASILQTNYLDGQIYGARLSKYFLEDQLSTSASYRYGNFDYLNAFTNLVQHIAEIDLSYRATKKVFISLNLESTFQKDNQFNRLYMNLRRNF